MMIKSLEIQKAIVNGIKNAEFLQKNNVKVFISVPSKAKTPYIKIANVLINNCQQNTNIKSFTFDLFVATDSKNNRQILEIMECLFYEIEERVNQYISKNNLNIEIFNIYNIKYNISENLQSNSWNGHFFVDIDIANE